jgi:3-oxoacyl-[acyl-carrier-protein] synthase II
MTIWVTGVGIVSPLAPTARATMDRVCQGTHAFRRVTLFDPDGQRCQIAAEVPGLRVQDVAPRNQGHAWSRTDALAVTAAREALQEARIVPSHGCVDLVVGTTTGATFETEESLPGLLLPDSRTPLTQAIVHPLSLTVEHVASALGPFRRRRLVSSACSTGANALLLAAAWLRSGLSSCVLAGASDSLCRLTFTGFNALGSLDPAPCRPFDASRAGLGLGEGAAFLVLEREDHAQERGAHPIAELVGWAAGAEAHHITNPEPDGTIATRTMRRALEVAGLGPDDVDYVNAHGTATPLNDPMEVQAIRQALGNAFDRVLVSSTKGQLGHSLGAAGAVEAALTALAIDQQRVPPTAGLTTPAADCQAHHVLGSSRPAALRAALSNSFGFGGLDGVVVLARPGFAPERETVRKTVWVHGGAAALHDGVHDVLSARWSSPHGSPGPLPDELTSGLDPARARRLGRAERILAAVVAAVHPPDEERTTGIVAGKPSGNPDATSRFLDRVHRRGPRFASPADFPNLMLSSLAGHVSIYQRLHGLALATSSTEQAGTASLLTACELVASGIPDRIFAAAVDPWGMVAETNPTQHTEAAAALLLDASSPGIARLVFVDPASLPTFPGPSASSKVLQVGDSQVLDGTPWRDVHATRAEDVLGSSAALGVAAVVLATAWVAAGADRVLVLLDDEGEEGGEGRAIVSVEAP